MAINLSVTRALFVVTLAFSPRVLLAASFGQTNLVSNVSGLAYTTDGNLKNPWGVAFSATSPFWISNQGSGTSTLYDGAGNKVALTVTIPGSATPPTGPTGQVFSSSGFNVNGSPSHFIFDTLSGTIAGWNSPTSPAVTEVINPWCHLYWPCPRHRWCFQLPVCRRFHWPDSRVQFLLAVGYSAG